MNNNMLESKINTNEERLNTSYKSINLKIKNGGERFELFFFICFLLYKSPNK